uniref:Uncharacterized protein n=1 Tax=Panagrolaimus davidi TaxID=227884 RepID=A0A914QD91_9BILA
MFHLQNIQRTFTSLQSYCDQHSWDDNVAYKIMTDCANQFDSGAYYLRTSQCIVEAYDKNYKRANYAYMAITYEPVGGYNNHGVYGYGYHHLFRFDNRNIILLRSKSHYTTCKVLSSVDDLYKQSEGGREYGKIAKYAFEKCGDMTAVAFIRAKGVDQTSWTTKPEWFINKQYIGNNNVNSFVYAGFK